MTTNCSRNQTIFVPSGVSPSTRNYTYREIMRDCKEQHLRQSWLLNVLYSKIGPFVISFILMTNILICIILTRKHMISPTNLILLGMAVADMLTALFPLPIYLAQNFPSFMETTTVTKSYVNLFMQNFLPTVFHTVSIWLTVALAVQRCIYVTKPASATTICTIRSSLWTIASVYILATLTSVIPFIAQFASYDEMCLNATNPHRAILSRANTVLRCNPIGDMPKIVQLWFRIFACNVIPCLSLCLFTLVLCVAIKRTELKRRKLTGNKSSGERGRMKESNSTSKMLIFVLVIFLVVEIPQVIIMLLYRIHGQSLQNIIRLAINISNYSILLSYPINFFVYYTMSQQFRETFQSLFCAWRANSSGGNAHGGKQGTACPQSMPLRAVKSAAETTNYEPVATSDAAALADNNGVKC